MRNKSAKTYLVSAISAAIVLAIPAITSAEIIHKREYQNRDTCYRAKKIPATVAYNTRGLKVRDASRSWEGNMQKNGALVRDRYNDEVFITTSTIIEDQHMTLVPVRCK